MLAIGGQAPKAIRSVECYDFKVILSSVNQIKFKAVRSMAG